MANWLGDDFTICPPPEYDTLNVPLSAYWDTDWDPLRKLARIWEVDNLTERFCTSSSARERQLGADILNRVIQYSMYDASGSTILAGTDTAEVLAKAADRLFAMLSTEEDTDVLDSVIAALGFLKNSEAFTARVIDVLLPYGQHPHEDVRYAVAAALWGSDDPRAIDTLLTLMTDSDSDVRDWATFGIGGTIETDSPAIREALFARLQDTDPTTEWEAMVGLARRGDSRVVDLLIALPYQVESRTLEEEAIIEAAKTTGDPRLLPQLESLKEQCLHDENRREIQRLLGNDEIDCSNLQEAIDACRSRRSAR